MGTTTSFGQQPQIVSQHGLADMNFNGMNAQMNHAAPIPPTTSGDLLAAANILQSTPNGRSQSLSNEAIFRGQEFSIPPPNGQIRPQSISYPPPPSHSNMISREPVRDDPNIDMRDTFYSDMVFGRSAHESSRQRILNQTHSKADIKWGSDTSFNALEGFIPPTQQRKAIARIDIPFQIKEEDFIEAPNSLEISRPVSPSAVTTHAPPPPKASSPRKRRFTSHINYSNDEDMKPKRRRKGKFQNHDDDDDSSTGPNKWRSTKDSPVSDQCHKRRKSTTAATAKAARENLTEDQKRETTSRANKNEGH